MRIGVIGGGLLGLTLAHRLAKTGHEVELFEAAPQLGGLSTHHDYGPFVWDRFYHCILPQDQQLLTLIAELGLEGDLRWTKTGTGYYAGGRSYTMSSNADFLRFPLLSPLDKVRLGAMILYATKVADPWKLYNVSAEAWLSQICGRRGYEVFWRPLLRAKFGPFYDQIAAVFIWATLTRLFGARSATTSKEKLGYVSGGYRRILESFERKLQGHGAKAHTSAPVTSLSTIENGENGGQRQCVVGYRNGTGDGEKKSTFDQVFFTGPTRLLSKVADKTILPYAERMERAYPSSEAYLGVACLVLVTKRPLTPYYVLNIGEESPLTGLIEMTNLIDPREETGGHSLIYLPKYMDSGDPRLDREDGAFKETLMKDGVLRLFPELSKRDIVYDEVHRTRFVQPLPLVRHGEVKDTGVPVLERPFALLNTSMLACATLNNNEVVGLVNRYLDRYGRSLS